MTSVDGPHLIECKIIYVLGKEGVNCSDLSTWFSIENMHFYHFANFPGMWAFIVSLFNNGFIKLLAAQLSLR